MKKLSLKSKILLGAFLVGGLGAGATEAVKTVSALQETRYNWTSTSIAPENPSSSLPNQTRAGAIDHFGCENGSQLCASGTRVSGSGPATDQLQYN